jgi:hypothetical protein
MNNLALILYDQRKLQEAEVMYLDTLKGRPVSLRPDLSHRS